MTLTFQITYSATKYMSGESDCGSDGQTVEEFIFLVEIPDDSHGINDE